MSNTFFLADNNVYIFLLMSFEIVEVCKKYFVRLFCCDIYEIKVVLFMF